jgi:hypothetical protein
MDFQQLLAKMQELDKPAPETRMAEAPIVTDEGGCGMDPPMPPPMSSMPPKPDEPPPSMSVNMNAQGMDNIEQLLKLITKVNPDMQKPDMPPLPSMSAPPSIMNIKPELPPLKMLPDLDAGNDMKIGGEMDSDYDKDGKLDPHEKDHASEKPLLKSLDKDGDGDHDMDDHDTEKKKEAYANEPDESEAEITDITRSGDDLHRKKMMFKATAGGDNPMATEGSDLRSQIRAELLRRLEEAKGAK